MTDFTIAFAAAKEHACAEFPKESCGVVVDGQYIRCENKAKPVDQHVEEGCKCQLCSFRIDNSVYLKNAGKIQMVLHSHPNGPAFPSASDMAGQIATALPWGIIVLDEMRVWEPMVWGGSTEIPEIIGRQFVHGITDCYDLIRDTFRLGKTALAEQGVSGWPFDPIVLPAYARNDGWWTDETSNFYEVEPFKIGFREVPMSEARPGDVFLCAIRSKRLNHGGVLLGDTIMHHLPGRLSRREPAGLWARQAARWIRYVGEEVK